MFFIHSLTHKYFWALSKHPALLQVQRTQPWTNQSPCLHRAYFLEVKICCNQMIMSDGECQKVTRALQKDRTESLRLPFHLRCPCMRDIWRERPKGAARVLKKFRLFPVGNSECKSPRVGGWFRSMEESCVATTKWAKGRAVEDEGWKTTKEARSCCLLECE